MFLGSDFLAPYILVQKCLQHTLNCETALPFTVRELDGHMGKEDIMGFLQLLLARTSVKLDSGSLIPMRNIGFSLFSIHLSFLKN